MKKIISLITGTILIMCACGQTNPPSVVVNGLKKMFPDVTQVKWSKEDSSEWESEFVANKIKTSVSFDNNGKWLETERKLFKKDLPPQIFKNLYLKFESFKIEEIEGIEKPDFSGYEIELEKKNTKIEIIVDKLGEITIKNVFVDDEEEDKEEINNQKYENENNIEDKD